MSDGSNEPLIVRVADGRLVITIGIDVLAFATEQNPDLAAYDEADAEFYAPKVTDPAVFAEEIRRRLGASEEDGTTPVHRMLDKATLEAVEFGAEGIETGDDLKIKARYAKDFPLTQPL